MQGTIRIVPLGGLGEVGKNMMAIQHGEDIVIVDSGVMFPREEMRGIDLVIPDTSFLLEHRSQVRGVLITHGHEDHTGALPYLLRDLQVPVYAPALAHDLITVKLREHAPLHGGELRKVRPGDRITLGTFEIEFFSVCHSIPDACGLAIRTEAGLVVHTGDFKIDQTPVDGRTTDLERIEALGREGVLLLLSDSTYAEVDGYTPSETVVGTALKRIVREAPGRVLIATFASLIARVQQVIDAASEVGRSVAVTGRTMTDNVTMGLEKGYLNAHPGVIKRLDELAQLSPDRQVIVMTGAQGEPFAVLARVASGNNHQVSIEPADTVVVSASTIPGNERAVADVIDGLTRLGATVLTRLTVPDIHVPGHAHREELKQMLALVKPRYFVPVHGEYRMLAAHAQLAAVEGIPRENIFVLEDGDVLELDSSFACVVDSVPAGHVYVDGNRLWGSSSPVLRERRTLSRDGFVAVVVPISRQTGAMNGHPRLISRGFLDLDTAEDLIEQGCKIVETALQSRLKQPMDDAYLTARVRQSLGKFLYEQTGRRPMILALRFEASE